MIFQPLTKIILIISEKGEMREDDEGKEEGEMQVLWI